MKLAKLPWRMAKGGRSFDMGPFRVRLEAGSRSVFDHAQAVRLLFASGKLYLACVEMLHALSIDGGSISEAEARMRAAVLLAERGE
jgi:hypothetical protein